MLGTAAATRCRIAWAGGSIVGAVRADNDGGGRRLPLAPKRAFVSHDYVNSRGFDAAHHLDRASQFPLDRAHSRHFLHEGGQAERSQFVIQFVAHGAAVRQTLLRERHSRLRALSHGDQDGGAVGADVERDPRLLERGADPDDVVAIQSGI
jgi:hypothetical protein